MGRQHRTRAIVISKSDFGEADRYVEVLTRDWGILTVLARSARKSKRRYVGGLDLFCHNEICVRGDTQRTPYLVELSVVNPFSGIRNDLEKLFFAGKLIQWIRKTVKVGTVHTYTLLGQTLSLIEKETDLNRLEALGLVFKMKLLSEIGMQPQTQNCLRCEEIPSQKSWFHIPEGGVICSTCYQKSHEAVGMEFLPNERMILASVPHYRLGHWPKNIPEPLEARKLSHLVTQFATFHSQVSLPA